MSSVVRVNSVPRYGRCEETFRSGYPSRQPLEIPSMSTDNALSWTFWKFARLRDAVRTLRGKRPKYTVLARQMETEQHAAYHFWANPARGICTEADVKHGMLAPDECEFFEHLLTDACQRPGPIVQFGTLLGHTIDLIGAVKLPQQKVVTIDPAFANPWNMPADSYRALSDRLLHRWLADGTLVRFSASPREYFRSYCDVPPTLVFLNHVGSYDDARRIIRWAKAIGAEAIAGRGYEYGAGHIVRAVDEAGGPDAIEGNVWRLRMSNAKSPAQHIEFRTRAQTCETTAPSPAAGLVSIVIPAFNAREFINDALHDVSRQTYGNWEVIVVEDGSDDEIGDVVEEFASRHPQNRVGYHRKPENTGVSSTRNVAIGLADGEFIAFLDADDRWAPDHLQRKVRLLCQTGGDVAYSCVDCFDSDSNRSEMIWGPTEIDLQSFPESLFRRSYVQPSAVVVRRSLTEDVGEFDEQLHFAEDYDYWFRAVKAGKLFYFDDKITSRYRRNHASAATTDRLVHCCQGIAEVTDRHIHLESGNSVERQEIVARHFLMAGTGHFGFRPTARNRCDPELGRQCLSKAVRLSGNSWQIRKYHLLAQFAVATRTAPLWRFVFRDRYERCRK
jgi:teichuronic acid biosynthesis glycosyltransferase TuaG